MSYVNLPVVSRVGCKRKARLPMDPKKPAVAGLALGIAVAAGASQVAEKGAIDFPQAAVNSLSFSISTDTGASFAREMAQFDATNDNLYVAEPPRKPGVVQLPIRLTITANRLNGRQARAWGDRQWTAISSLHQSCS